MEIKKNPPINNQTNERKKEEKVLPRRSFHEVMAKQKTHHKPEKRRSIFDMASKDKQKSGSPLKKKEADHAPHHGEGIQEGMAPLEVSENLSVSTITELSPEMAILVEKMANFIQVESQNGISTTTVLVEMDGSVLDGSQIVIDHYDTAPQSFNLQLSGSPEAADLLSANLASLQASLQTHQTLQGFQVHVLPPTLSEKSDLYSRDREKKGKLGSKDKSFLVEGKKKISF